MRIAVAFCSYDQQQLTPLLSWDLDVAFMAAMGIRLGLGLCDQGSSHYSLHGYYICEVRMASLPGEHGQGVVRQLAGEHGWGVVWQAYQVNPTEGCVASLLGDYSQGVVRQLAGEHGWGVVCQAYQKNIAEGLCGNWQENTAEGLCGKLTRRT
jgi:hypothetical protein